MCSGDLEETIEYCLFVSVELKDHQPLPHEPIIVSCSVVRDEFHLGTGKMNFSLAQYCESVDVLPKYTILVDCSSKSQMNPVVICFAYPLLFEVC